MPCYDNRAELDSVNTRRRYDAMTAILCGTMNQDPRACELATRWHEHHKRIDRLRAKFVGDRDHPQIETELAGCDRVLDEAYELLCKERPHL